MSLKHALWTAADFGDVLPLSSERKPLVSFDSATSDPEAIERMWRQWPDAGVGLCAWSASLVAIDIEHPSKGNGDGFATIAKLEAKVGPLPPTRTHATKSGGEHRVYAVGRETHPPLRSSQGFLRHGDIAAPGVDIVAGRAVLRWPPTPGYTILHPGQHPDRIMDGGGECAPLPDAWVRALGEPPPPPPKPVLVETRSDGRVYAVAAMVSETRELAKLAAGRNCALTKSAYCLGQLSPPLSPDEIESFLLEACEFNGSLKEHGQRACVQTIARGIRAGQRNPRHIEARL